MNISDKNDLSPIGRLSDGLKKLVVAEFVTLDETGVPAEAAGAFQSFNQLSKMLQEVFEFSRELADGNVSVAPPARSNYLSMGLKTIHSQLMHIIWQAEQIAAGDYSQTIDFMGDFGRTFNWTVESIRKRSDELQANRDMLVGLFNALHSLILLIECETGRIVFYNKAAEAVCQGRAESDGEPRDSLLFRLRELCKLPSPDDNTIYFDPRDDRWYKIFAAETQWTNHKTVRLFNCVDITKERSEYEHVKKEALDALTGLYTRSQGMPKIEELFRGLRPGFFLCVVFFDVDGLKRVNDTLGHAAGDDLIRRFGAAMKKTFRSSDVLVRMGGDEFLAVFSGREKAMIQDILHRFEKIVAGENPDHPVKLEYSCGICCAEHDSPLAVAELIARADAEMYGNKKARKTPKGPDANDR